MQALCNLTRIYGPLAARFLITFLFLRSALEKTTAFAVVADMMAGKGMPFAEVLLVGSIVLETAGSLMVLLGWHARWGAVLLAIFLVPATLIFHNFWAIDPALAREAANQANHFFKNVSILGALVMIMAVGAGPLSLTHDKDSHGH